jgi:hypothetical protein
MCLRRDIGKRMQIQEILKHPWTPPRGRFLGFLVFFLMDLTELDYRTIIELYSDLIFLEGSDGTRLSYDN